MKFPTPKSNPKLYIGLLAVIVFITLKLLLDPAHFKAKESIPDISKDVLLQFANIDQDEQE